MTDPNQRDIDRKNTEEENPPLRYKIIESAPAGSRDQSETTEPPEEPLRYKVIESAPRSADDELSEAAHLYPFRASAEAEAQKAAAEPPAPAPKARAAWTEKARKFAESPVRVFIAAVLGFGILFGVIVAAVSWFTGSPEGRYDLGSADAAASGLTGHLYIEWDQHLTYRLKIGPSDPSQQAGFALVVAHPPRPLAITLHLQNSEGFVLCSKEIVLKYDPRDASSPASDADSQTATADAADVAVNHLAQELAYVPLDAQEADREQGKDIFRNENGPDGQIADIRAQGTIPCSARSYENTESWSFTPDFPSLAAQSELVERQKKAQAEAARRAEQAHRKKAPRPAVKLLPFSMEGDDSIVAFDPVHGILQTNGDKIFYFNKSAVSADPSWQEYPVGIHYRCDRASNCVLMHGGAGALRARLKR